MNRRLKILHIEDVPSDAELVERTLRKSGIDFEKITVDKKDEYIDALVNFKPDIILSDHSLPSFNSLEALKIMKETGVDVPFILITSTVSEEFAVNVMKEGASDYVLKDRLQRLPNAVLNALEKFHSDTERQSYLNKVPSGQRGTDLKSRINSRVDRDLWRYNVKSGLMDWSMGTYPLLGYDRGEVEPSVSSFTEHIIDDDKNAVKDIFKNTTIAGQAGIDFAIVNKDGSRKYILAQFETEPDENGLPEYIAGFNQDVTKQKLAQIEIQNNIEELQAAGERQSAILNALPPHIVLLNEAGKIVAANESWRKFTLKNNLGVPRYGIDFSYAAISEKATGVDELSGKQIAKGRRDVISGIIDRVFHWSTPFTKNAGKFGTR